MFKNYTTMKDFITAINIYDYEHFRDEVMEKCNISRSTWSAWRNGGKVTEKYKPIIDEIAMRMFGKKVFNKEAQDEN